MFGEADTAINLAWIIAKLDILGNIVEISRPSSLTPKSVTVPWTPSLHDKSLLNYENDLLYTMMDFSQWMSGGEVDTAVNLAWTVAKLDIL
jgi:hypothetical protein